MTIQELGSLGELVGAIAVLATLVYLAIQTRQTRIATEQTARFSGLHETYSVVSLYTQARNTLVNNPGNRDLVARGNAGEELSAADRFALSIMFDDFFFTAAYSYVSAASSGSIHEATGDIEYIVSILSENPIMLEQWNRKKATVHKMGLDFVPRVDAALAATPR